MSNIQKDRKMTLDAEVQLKDIQDAREARFVGIDKSVSPEDAEKLKDIIVTATSQSYENFEKALSKALDDIKASVAENQRLGTATASEDAEESPTPVVEEEDDEDE